MAVPTLPGPVPEAGPVDFEAFGESGGWSQKKPSADGAFVRAEYPFKGRIAPGGPFPPARDRYVLYISWACPWAHRQAITGPSTTASTAVASPAARRLTTRP